LQGTTPVSRHQWHAAIGRIQEIDPRFKRGIHNTVALFFFCYDTKIGGAKAKLANF
jgi:hypothetical protein